MRQSLLIWTILIIGFSACEDPIDITLPAEESKIVAISNFSPDENIRVYLSKEKNVNSDSPTTYITEADINIRLNGQILGKFTAQPPDNVYPGVPYFEANFRPKIGRAYTLEVEVEGNPKIKANDEIPNRVPIDEVTLDSVTLDFTSQVRDEAIYTFYGAIEIEDPRSINNYYHLAEAIIPIDWFSFTAGGETCCIVPNKEVYKVPISILDTQDPAFIPLIQEDGFLFNDRDFDGQRKRVPFRASLLIKTSFQQVNKIHVLLRSVSSDYFRYHSTFTRQLATRESPFSEPVIIFNNVENGLGNFAGYSMALDSVKVTR